MNWNGITITSMSVDTYAPIFEPLKGVYFKATHPPEPYRCYGDLVLDPSCRVNVGDMFKISECKIGFGGSYCGDAVLIEIRGAFEGSWGLQGPLARSVGVDIAAPPRHRQLTLWEED